MEEPLYLACSAQKTLFKMSDQGAAVIAGYWSPELGLRAQPVVLQWKNGRVASLQPLNDLVTCTENFFNWSLYFLIPGWLDAHVHLSLDSIDFYQCLENWKNSEFIEKNMKEYLQHYLKLGIVGIRDGGDLPGFAWLAKNNLNKKVWSGPKVVSVREAVNRAGMYGRFLGRGFETIQAWRKTESDFFAEGLDQLKVVVTGLIRFDKYQVIGPTQWTVEELSELVEAAHRRQRLVMAHASGEEGISVAIAAGVDSIEHAYYVTTEQLELMREKRIAWVPTIAPIGNILKYPTERYSPQEIDILERILDNQLSKVNEAYRHNVRLGVGTDAGAYLVPHGDGFYDELDWMVQAGIPKLEVYRLATQENAAILGTPELGRLEIGTPISQLQLVKSETM